jgi:hypothetical protein
MCQRPLGDLPKAVTAAFLSSAGLALLWAGFALVTGHYVWWFAVLFGGLVSGAVAHSSSGRGPTYQLVATTATVVGLAVGELLVVLAYHRRLDLLSNIDEVSRIVLSNDWSMVCCVLGVVGGLWL